MREIKFRGKRISDGKWIYGFYAKWDGDETNEDGYAHTIFGSDWETMAQGELMDDFSLVDPRTVGEFTGIKDKNKVEIYEGDILSWPDFYRQERRGLVTWCEQSGGWMIDREWLCAEGNKKSWDFLGTGGFNRRSEVIGNIHENPELLNV